MTPWVMWTYVRHWLWYRPVCWLRGHPWSYVQVPPGWPMSPLYRVAEVRVCDSCGEVEECRWYVAATRCRWERL